jgi:Ring finger domain
MSELNNVLNSYQNMFKMISDYQTVLTNLQYEILTRTQYTCYTQHFEIYKDQIASNVEQLETLLSMQTKIIDKMNELTSVLINNYNPVNSNVSIFFGTRRENTNAVNEELQEILSDPPSSLPGVENLVFGAIQNPQNNQCPITHEFFTPESEVSRIISCGHIFSRGSLLRWLSLNQTCPNCRSQLNETRSLPNLNGSPNLNSPITNLHTPNMPTRSRIPTNRLNRRLGNTLSEITETMLSRFLPNLDADASDNGYTIQGSFNL